MPLPAALLARLKNRGIVAPKNQKPQEDEEEVFAENYDESDKSESSESSGEDEEDDSENSLSEDEEKSNEKNIKEPERTRDSHENKELIKRSDCPNSNNPYHECSTYCRKKYGVKKFEPDPIIERRRLRMLQVYPLLPNWCEVPDLNTNRYYYWNIETDQVSWLSPSHPKAKFENNTPQEPEPVVNVNTKFQYEYPKQPESNITEAPREPKQSYYKKKSHQSSAIDPMDPSSYSDVKRGKWSAGMDGQPSVKIGSSVDEY